VTLGEPRQATGFGHGKVILLGEHAVVYGQPALAAGMSAGVTVQVQARPGSGRLAAAAWSLDARAGDGSQVGRALDAILGRLRARDLDFTVDARIPARVGLGSSAALSVAVARAAALETDATDDEALRAAADGEAVFHGSPSGIDAAAAARGNVGRFQRDDGWRPVRVRAPLALCIGLSGVLHDTAAQVAAVRRLRDEAPVVDRVLETMGAVAEAGVKAVEAGEIARLGRLFDVAHGLLSSLGVSSPELDTMVNGARRAGAVGAKLTGAGGGGAAIALAPGREDDVLARWRADGFDGFQTVVGGEAAAP